VGAGGSAVVYGKGLGLVGAVSAVGQTLLDDHTYELIAYRSRQNLGKPRLVDKESVIRMDRLTSPTTFNNYDSKHKRVLITPHGPDPVLLGLRGESPQAVLRGFQLIRVREPIERWVIFRTNHGTEAHFRTPQSHGRLATNRAVWIRGVVSENPKRIPGGHVFVRLRTSQRAIQCAAFAPTGKFKETVAELIPGDEITAYGGIRSSETTHPGTLTLNLEKMRIDNLTDDIVMMNPQCPECGG
jgi:tRNA(Ile2)-agmatinylcytidine synthase